MALPKEPRQKMINMMYLVLTALLALNVSAEIINAFKVVDNSLNQSNNVLTQSTASLYSSFEELLKDPKTAEKAAIWKPKADQARELSKKIPKDRTISMPPPVYSTPGVRVKISTPRWNPTRRPSWPSIPRSPRTWAPNCP